jgi:hypothetical protein
MICQIWLAKQCRIVAVPLNIDVSWMIIVSNFFSIYANIFN